MKYIQVFALFLAFSAYSSISFASDFYKWIDDKGVTHYSERKPTNQNSEIFSTKTQGKKAPTYIPFSDEAIAAENTEAPQEVEPPKKETAAIKKEDKKPAKKEIKRDKAACERAKKDEIALRNNPMIMQDGKILTVDEKNEQLEAIKEIKKVHCK